jgi:tellurite resistance protein TehA-like permease
VSNLFTMILIKLSVQRWFAVTMGTGIVAVLLKTIPFDSPALHYLSIIFFILNTILFTLAMGCSIARYTLFPGIWGVMINDPVNSLFLGCVPMGFATLINMWVLVCVPIWGDWAKTAALTAWIIDTVVAVLCTIALPMML